MDPLMELILAACLALLLLAASQHKRSAPGQFRGRLAAYGLVPDALLTPVARSLPWLELALGLALLIPASRPLAALLTATLLAIYSAAILINLQRGHSQLDCGCGGPAQPLSIWLLLRNGALIGAAVLITLPADNRSLSGSDAVALLLASALLAGSYLALGQLLSNAAQLKGWHHHES